MKKELIKTENYLLVVDDSEIKDVRPYKGKWHLEKGYILNKFPVYLTDLSYCKIIIAHLPLNDSPILEGVSLLPPLEDDVEMMAEEEYPIIPYTSPNINWDRANKQEGFESGYNKAREKWDDVLKWIDEEILLNPYYKESPRLKEGALMVKAKIQSLSQPKTPSHFEFEMEDDFSKNNDEYIDELGAKGNYHTHLKIIKTTTNSQGQQVACGKYLFEL